jgi:GNAT superfamily N-acetyltransferase
MPATVQREVGRNIDFANPPTEEKAKAALSSSKQPFWREHESLPEGSPVGVRIDIPAFLDRGTYVQTIHEPATPGNVGDRIGYDTNVRLSGPVRFFVKEGSEESKLGAVAIKEGRATKHPIATVEGRLVKDRSIPSDIETWTPVGMDPKKHSYFYDKRTDQPVTGGSESFSVGNTVFVKNPVYGKPQDFRYMPAGEAGQGAPKRYETVDSFREHWNSLGVRNMTDIRGRGTPYEHIRPSEIEVEKANRNKGLGTAFMQDLTEFADSKGLQIRVNPSDELGATSKGRLEKFYKRFGFVENKPGKNKDYTISERFYRPASQEQRFMPSPDSAMPGAYSFQGGYRAIPGKTKGSLRLYGPAGNLIGIASSLDEAQRILRRKAKQ